MDEKQVERIQEAVSKLGPKDHELLSDELDAVTGGAETGPIIAVCVSGCAGSSSASK